ncbi:MAG: phage major capsid protein [Bacteroidota bacterium]|nr:phage major capsid protein [Bacteroidota bacterium]
MSDRPYDISGWATMCNIKCTDGRTIRPNAFIDNDGEEVPMVYQHCHTDPENILGHALLENRDKGVYCYCWFNNNDKAQAAKNAVANGDIKQFSIYANQLVQRGNDVIHGSIKEVSLVLTGANKGARIENLNFAHSDGTYDTDDEEALIYTKQQKILCHSEEDLEDDEMSKKANPGEINVQEIIDSMTDEQRMVLNAMYEQGQIDAMEELDNDEEDEVEDDEVDDEDDEDDEVDDEYEDDEDDEDDEVDDVDDEYEDDEDDEYEDEYEEDEAIAHSGIGGMIPMKKNVFDGTIEEAAADNQNVLSHAEIETIFKDAAKDRLGSLKASVLAHAADYGIEQIDWLFPDAKNLNNPPDFIHRDMGWVSKVMQGTRHTPFSRIKTMFADITADEARAKGYIKGNRKLDEVFTLLKRTTDPQTIYKKQKLDRDDVVDITDFDVVAWLKGEMRMMLDEEIARAILIGDGRQNSSDDKISESHIRSIFRDDDLYTLHKTLVEVQGEAKAKTFIKTVRKAWKDYKGSGNAVAFVTEDTLSDLLLLEDGIGHFLYPTKETAANVLGVRDIITVPVMADASTTRTDAISGKTFKPLAIILNLNDYNVGADKGGSVNMFEDFDIDYNQQKYLIETRCSGALVKPYSAIVIEEEANPQ